MADCRIGSLPRISEKTWPEGELARFLARAKQGTVAVDRQSQQTRIVSDCKLDGRYSEIAGERGGGRFWATGRVLFRRDEIAGPCQLATHVVAVYVLGGDGAKVSVDKLATFAAILVPLPCPSVSDPAPARGCVGRGLTGSERRERAQKMLAGVKYDAVPKKDPADILSVHVLAPDDAYSLTFVKRFISECALTEHVRWSTEQYRVEWDGRDRKTTASLEPKGFVPRLDMAGSDQSCLHRPVFLECFPGVFDPAPSGVGCWHSFDQVPR